MALMAALICDALVMAFIMSIYHKKIHLERHYVNNFLHMPESLNIQWPPTGGAGRGLLIVGYLTLSPQRKG